VPTEPSNDPGVILVGRRTQEATKDIGIDDESSHPGLCTEVANGVTRFLIKEAWVFSESRMREICLSGR
jgi:hypothetical protein